MKRALPLLLILLSVIAGCGKKPRNLVLITMDTTRADHLGCYGYKAHTPNIDTIADHGSLFENAFTAAPITGPSHTTILTGMYPPYHRIRDNNVTRLSPKLLTLAEIFKNAEYNTAAFVAAYPVIGSFGFSQGFDYFSDHFDAAQGEVFVTNLPNFGLNRRPGDIVAREFNAWLDKHHNQPFFAWVHFFDVHKPIDSPSDFLALFPDQPYDGELAFMDDCVGTVVRGLRRHHLENDTGMILVADHGEGLGDHGEDTHALLTFNSTLHVPLIMDFPWRQQAGKISQYVSTVDIAPTVVDAFDLELPKNAHPFQGESLVPWLDGRGGHEERSLYFECFLPFYHFDWYPLTGMIKGHHKLIEAPEPAIYDLRTDPHEEHKITNPEMLAEFRQNLVHLRAEIEKGHPEDNAADLDPESFKQLEALGYVGSAIVKDPTQLSQHELATLPDPQNSLGIWQDNNMAMAAARKQHWDEAIQSCRRVLDTQPGNRDALLLLAQARSIMGDFDGADRLYREILSRFADPETLQQAARYYLLLRNDPSSALSCLDALLAQWPDDANTLILKAQAEAKMGDLGQAETLLRRVVEADPKSRDGLLNLAELLHRRLGRAEEAGKLFRKAVEFYPFDPRAQFDFGVFLLKTGNPDEALRHFSQASTFAPGGVFDEAHLAMALIYRDEGKLGMARRRLHELLLATKNPELHRRAKSILGELSAGN